MNAPTRHEDVRAIRYTRHEISSLISRYPRLSDAETRRIIAFLRDGRHLDIGILTADAALKPQLDRFMADHDDHFRLSFADTARALAIIAAVVALCWLLWEAIKPAALTV